MEKKSKGEYMKTLNYNQKFIAECLKVMSFSKKDLEGDFREHISKTSKNGLVQSVWSRRADMLSESFEHDDNYSVLHIQRGGLWQFDPVFEENTGYLYVFFTKQNFRTIRNKYLKNGFSTHYALSLLIKNEGLIPIIEEMQLSLFDEVSDELERKTEDMLRMLGENAENVTRIRFLIVDYDLVKVAYQASLEEYTPELLLSAKDDVSYLLPSIANLEIEDSNTSVEKESEEEMLVSLKKQQKLGE